MPVLEVRGTDVEGAWGPLADPGGGGGARQLQLKAGVEVRPLSPKAFGVQRLGCRRRTTREASNATILLLQLSHAGGSTTSCYSQLRD
jgi:hypothetical protein